MVAGPKTEPLPEVQLVYKRNSEVGMALKAISDAAPPETGVTKLPPIQKKIWYKHERRWRYAKSYKDLRGKSMGGKFAKAPADAPPEKQARHHTRKKKRI